MQHDLLRTYIITQSVRVICWRCGFAISAHTDCRRTHAVIITSLSHYISFTTHWLLFCIGVQLPRSLCRWRWWCLSIVAEAVRFLVYRSCLTLCVLLQMHGHGKMMVVLSVDTGMNDPPKASKLQRAARRILQVAGLGKEAAVAWARRTRKMQKNDRSI